MANFITCNMILFIYLHMISTRDFFTHGAPGDFQNALNNPHFKLSSGFVFGKPDFADDACADPFWTLLACRFRRSPYPDAMFDGRAHSLVRVFESYTRASRSTRYNGHLSFLRRCTVVLLVYESEYFCLSVDFHGHAFLSARLFQAPP